MKEKALTHALDNQAPDTSPDVNKAARAWAAPFPTPGDHDYEEFLDYAAKGLLANYKAQSKARPA